MNKRELLTMVKTRLRLAAGYDGDIISEARVMALNYYFQRKRGDEVTGRSQVVSGDVSAMVESTLAQAMSSFMSKNLATFDALGQDDAAQAKLESETVNYLVMGRSNGFYHIAEAVKNAQLLRNGIMKVYVERTYDTQNYTYKNVSPEAAAQLTDIPNATVTINEYDPKKGKLRYRVKTEKRKFCVRSVDPANFLYDADWDTYDLQHIPFCAERYTETRARLIERGFPADKVNKLTKYGTNFKSDIAARRPRQTINPASNAFDQSQDMIEWYECYIMIGAADGSQERHKISVCQNHILEDEVYDDVPYAAGVIFINPQQFTGISQFDKLKIIQDINTMLHRALLDNINTTNKNRTAYVSGKVNDDDLSDGRINGNIRVKAGVQNIDSVLKAFTIPDTSANIVNAIEFMNRRRTEQGGASLDLSTANMQLNDRVGSQGLDRAYSATESLTELMVRTLAVTLIRSVWLLAHRVLRREYNEPVPVHKNGRWTTSIPSQWPSREAVTVKPGMSLGERTRRSAALMQLIQFQVSLAERGMEDVLVDRNSFYEAVLEWAELNDIPNPERFFLDPMSPRAQEALASKAQASQMQTAKQDALMNQAVALEQLRTAFEKYKQDTELQFKYWAKTMDVEMKEAEIVGTATTQIITKGNDNEQNEKPSTQGNSGGNRRQSTAQQSAPQGRSEGAS